MSVVVQLSLWDILDTASKTPVDADLFGLLDRVSESIEFLPTSEKLAVAGEAIRRLGEIYGDRCAVTLAEIGYLSHPEREPCLPLDAFDIYVRQSSFVDLEQFIESPVLPEVERGYERSSVVRELSVAEALAEVGDEVLTEEMEVARVTDLVLGIAHEEEIEQWVTRIRSAMKECDRMLLVELQERSKLEFVDLWLGLMLGNTGYIVSRQLNCNVELSCDFYDLSRLWIVKI
ncbi:hypothetical protein [Chamaesiphon polymorphus]|uniref:Uncharacterized protein n=1 Tax=Chamaesiphon polymorphus CCALA 037 TaxID=2107692 RepID=A0A2T1GJW1_9CYAN|nr:hypothetical protein [Chamaesiphon polymorphus]PSB57999.1 hypothetical protein C7B77_06425 [Chamaesiphon polymorphus CCALA 037]